MASLEALHRVEMRDRVLIPLPDRRRLSARIWSPVGGGSFPAILEYLPYRKSDGTAERDAQIHPWLAARGYHCLRVDIAGTGESEGLFDDEYSEQELTDGEAVVAWIAAQDWCSGAVGMTGISWGGFNGLQLAARRPSALKAVVSICSTTDRYADDIHYKGGCLLGENAGWASVVMGWFGLPPDPEVYGPGWREAWLERLDQTPFLAAEWLKRQVRDDYWRHGSVCEDWRAIEAPVLAVGGWHDGYRNTPAALAAELAAPVKAIVGPWDHRYPHMAGPAPAIGFLEEMVRWYDRWLKGELNGADQAPAYRAYLMDHVKAAPDLTERPGRWIAEPVWPPARLAVRDVYLTNDGLFEQEAPCEREIGPDLLCGLCAEEYFAFGFPPGEMADDQGADDARSTTFDGLPVEAPLDIVGAPRLRLTVASDQPKAQLVARLCDLAPDGSSTLISLGVLNLRQRHGPERMVDLTPDRAVEVELKLDQCAHRLPAGHAFRLSLSTSYWPYLWPEPALATLTVFGGAVSVPLRPLAKEAEWSFPAPETPPPLETRALSPETSDKRVDAIPGSGETRVTLSHDTGEVEHLASGLVSRTVRGERWRIRSGDPLSARSTFTWERTMRRGDWSVRLVATLIQWSDAQRFHVEGDLVAYEGDEQVFSRSFGERVPRA